MRVRVSLRALINEILYKLRIKKRVRKFGFPIHNYLGKALTPEISESMREAYNEPISKYDDWPTTQDSSHLPPV